MRCDPVRPDPARVRRRTGTRPSAGRAHRMVVLAAVAAVAVLSVGCVRPAAESTSPGPADPGTSATAGQQSAMESGTQPPAGGPDGGASPNGGPDAGAAPGGPIGEAGGGGTAPGGPVGPGARPPAGGGAAPAKKPGGGNQAQGSPVKIPSFTEIGSPFTPELQGRIEAASAAACQEAGNDANCLALSYVMTTPDDRVCTFGGLSPANGTVAPGTTVTVQLSGSEPCPTTDDNGGTGGGSDGGTQGGGTGGTTGDATPGGGTGGGGTTGGGAGNGAGTTGGGDGSTGGSDGTGGGTTAGGGRVTAGSGSGTTGGTGARPFGGGATGNGDSSGTNGDTSSGPGGDTTNGSTDTGGAEVPPGPSGG